jgi:hypothetical protein
MLLANGNNWPLSASCKGHRQHEIREVAIGSSRPKPSPGIACTERRLTSK